MVRDFPDDARLVVGFDRRFLSDRFAQHIARELAALGIEIWLSPDPIPTPALSYAIQRVDAVGGIMVTGGAHPSGVNGIALRGWDGGALPRWMLDQIEEITAASSVIRRIGPTAKVISLDVREDYLSAIGHQVSLKAIRSSGITVAIDSMWGSAGELLPRLIDGDGSRSIEIRASHNPAFPELDAPKPFTENLARLRRIVRTGDAALGLALSADGCTLGVIDENGAPVSPGVVTSLLAWYLLFVKREAGAVARTITSSNGIDRIAQSAGVPLHELPYGHTAVCETLREQSPMLLADDEGGHILTDHIYERDGLMSAMLLVSCLVRTGMELSQLVEEILPITGARSLQQTRIELTAERAELCRVRLAREEWPEDIAGRSILDHYATDGIKFELDRDAWLLIRHDEIDEVLQICAEAPSNDDATQLLQSARQMMLV